MSLYVSNVSRLAEAIDATALIVHHAGKDPTRGARGSSSLKAAVDVEIEIAREGGERVGTITKARDGEDGARFGFRLQQIELGVDVDGDPVRSCVIEPVESVPDLKRTGALSGAARATSAVVRLRV